MYAMLYGFVFVFGCCIGSFLNVVIWRVPKKISFVKGRSFCPHCEKPIAWYDNIPIISFLVLRGRGRCCGGKISPRYPIVETLTGALFLVVFVVLGFTPVAAAFCAVAAILVCVAFVDMDTMEIPNGFIIALAVPAALLVFLQPEVSILSRVIGFFAVSLPMFLLALVMGAFGGGDIKLYALCGFILGWKILIPAFFFALITGSVVGLIQKRMNKLEDGHTIPFGPHICVGVYMAALVGTPLINWYLSLFQL